MIMPPDFGPKLDPTDQIPDEAREAEMRVVLGDGSSTTSDAEYGQESIDLATDTQSTNEAATSRPEEVSIDEDLVIAVKGLLDRLGGRARIWNIVYEVYGVPSLPETEYIEFMGRMIKLVEAGEVARVSNILFASPEEADVVWRAEKERMKAKKRRHDRRQGNLHRYRDTHSELGQSDRSTAGAADEISMAESLPLRRHRQTPEEVEEMMRHAFGSSSGNPYRGSPKKGRSKR